MPRQRLMDVQILDDEWDRHYYSWVYIPYFLRCLKKYGLVMKYFNFILSANSDQVLHSISLLTYQLETMHSYLRMSIQDFLRSYIITVNFF